MNQRRADIERAFDTLHKQDRNGFVFQRIARRLLVRAYPNLNPLPDLQDEGRDAVASPLTPVNFNNLHYAFFFSLTSTLTKLRHDCEQCRNKAPEVDVVVFTTWGEVSGRVRSNWETRVRTDYGLDLIIHDKTYLLDEAERPEHEDLIADELGVRRITVYIIGSSLDPSHSGAFHPGVLNPSHRIQVVSEDVMDDLLSTEIKYGIELRNAWKFEESVQTFLSALHRHQHYLVVSDLAKVHRNIASTYRDLGKFDKAADHFAQALEIEPCNVINHTNMVVAAIDRGSIAEAEKLLSQICSGGFAPDAQALLLYAYVLTRNGDDQAALAKLDEALAVDPNFVRAHINRGVTLRRTGDLRSALHEFELSCHIDPDEYFAQAIRLETMTHMQLDGVERYDLGTICHEVDIWLARICINGRTIPHTLYSTMAMLHTSKGLALLFSDKLETATVELRKALTYGDEPELHQNLGIALLKQQLDDEAEATLREALARGARNATVLYNIASIGVLRFLNNGGDAALLDDASTFMQELKGLRSQGPDDDLLEALMICADSIRHGEDRGLTKAKKILHNLVLNNDCPHDLRLIAFENLQNVERRISYFDDKRRQAILRRRRLVR